MKKTELKLKNNISDKSLIPVGNNALSLVEKGNRLLKSKDSNYIVFSKSKSAKSTAKDLNNIDFSDSVDLYGESVLFDGGSDKSSSNALSFSSFESSDAVLNAYIVKVRSFKFLTKEEEVHLMKLCKSGDVKAFEAIVKSYLRFVVKVAFEYYRYGVPMMDLISEGNIGLLRAIDKFDVKSNNGLAAYSVWWIRAMIQSFILKSWSIVKISSANAERKLFFSLQKIKKHLGIENNLSMTKEELQKVSYYTGTNVKALQRMESHLYNGRESSIDALHKSNDNNDFVIDLPSDSLTPEESFMNSESVLIKKKKLASALSLLSERERQIIGMRFSGNNKYTLDFIGKNFGLSSERVRQILEKAIAKMRSFVSKNETSDCDLLLN